MIEEPKSAFEEIASDPNFLLILLGAAIWFLGFYVGFISGLFLTTGFALVCFAAAITSLSRPIASAWPGLLLGGLVQLIGYYLAFIPIVSPALVVTGGVMIVYFAVPLALQRGELPILTHIQKLLESKKKEEEIKDIEAEEPKDTETEPEDSEPDI